MAYWGNEPAKVAVKVGSDAITTTQIEDGQVYTADLQDDAVTANKIDDDGTGFRMGSLGLGAAVSGSHKLTVGGTATFSGDITGTLATASQGNITSVGTLSALAVTGTTTFTGSGDFVRANSNASNANCAFALSNQTNLKWSMYNNASNNSWNLYDHAGSANSITVTTGGNTTFASNLVATTIESNKNGSDSATSGAYLRVGTASGTTNVWMWQLGASNQFDLWNYNAGGDNAWEKALTFTTTNLDATFAGNITTAGGMIITQADGSNTDAYFGLGNDADYGQIGANEIGLWNVNNNDIIFGTNNALRMTIANGLTTFTTDLKISDDLYFNGSDANAWIIGKTSGSGQLRIQNFQNLRIDGSEVAIKPPSSASANFYLQANGSNDARINFATQQSGTFWSLMMDHSDSQKIFFVDENGNDGVFMDTNNTAWQGNSDERMKENLVELDGALANLNTLRCVNFNMKHDKDNKRIGLIAQDVYKVYPEATSGSPDSEYSFDESRDGNSHKGAMGLRYTEMIPPMIKAIQELSAKVTALENA